MREPLSDEAVSDDKTRLCREHPEWAANRIRHMVAGRAKDREAMEWVSDQLGWHADDDADMNDLSPEDMAAHVNGLCRQRLAERLEAKQ